MAPDGRLVYRTAAAVSASRRASISLVGRNIWTHKTFPNIDPEFSYSSGNAQGFEYMPIPQNRSIGINLQITP